MEPIIRKSYFLKYTVIALIVSCMGNNLLAQSTESDSSFHPYNVNYWVTGTICGVGLLGNYLGIPHTLNKKTISLLEIQSLNKEVISRFDYWALKQDPSKTEAYLTKSNYVLTFTVALSFTLLFDHNIRKDWFNVMLMYMESLTITSNIYEWSFLGPAYQNRLRPVTYYDQLTYDQRSSGNNRNSFYSGHVATAALSTFFMAKVYSDFNPEIGNNKYFLYTAALIPPLVLGYCRVKSLRHFPSDIMTGIGIGALCGILIPELHRTQGREFSVKMYSSTEGTGLAVSWQPGFLK